MLLKKFIFITAAAAVCTLTVSCEAVKEINTVNIPEVTGEFKTTVLDVGKADAIILETASGTVVIDTGEKNDGSKVLSYFAEHGTDKIDYLFITHFDKDHVGGAADIINNMEIGEIITPNYEGNNKEYEKFKAALSEKDLTELRLTDYKTFTLDDTVFEIYPPKKSYYAEEDNDFSLVINVTHGENTFMYAGDCETERLAELPGQMSMEHIFLKMPHHGQYYKGIDELIKSAAPKYAVITDSEKNPADEEVLILLENIGCEIYETMYGNISAVSDGKSITVMQ